METKLAKQMLDHCRLRICGAGLELLDRRMDAVEFTIPLSKLRIVRGCHVDHRFWRNKAKLLAETDFRSFDPLVRFYTPFLCVDRRPID